MNKRKARGIGLLSGGLDSILAVKVLQRQNLELTGLTFVTPFFGPEAGLEAGRMAGISMEAVDIGELHMEMLKNPKYGYGSQMNPCIDCHALMLREAGKIMERSGADFLFTGEVLGQRPMSQRRDSLRSVEKLSGYPGRILRPLTAKHLPPTMVEQEGLVDRDQLLDIHGRGRKPQIELAARFGIVDYPQPGGGCMLTKEGFADRLRMFLDRYPEAKSADVEFLKWGRVGRLPHGGVCMIGRNKMENQGLARLSREQDRVLLIPDFPSPTGVLIGSSTCPKDFRLAALMLAAYSDAPPATRVRVLWRQAGKSGELVVTKLHRSRFRHFVS